MKGRASFVIARRLSTIRDADHVIVINIGNLEIRQLLMASFKALYP